MSTGTLVGVSRAAMEVLPDVTVGSTGEEIASSEARFRQQLLQHREKQPFFYASRGSYIAATGYFIATAKGYPSGTAAVDWYTVLSEVGKTFTIVWDTAKMRKLLADPLGAPIELTMEEAEEIVRLAYGRRPDLAPGEEFVEEVREILGQSLMERLKEIE